MYKKIVLLAFVSTLLLLATFGTQIMIPVNATTPEVHPGESIQTAINSANPGDTILVYAGMYYEHVVVNKTVLLIGENPDTTIIDGSGTGIVVKIQASNVTIRGFTIQNGGKVTGVEAGIYVTNHAEMISNNTIRNNYNGIWLQKSNGSNIVDNTIWNNTWGIHISESNENIIYGNTIANNSIGAWIASSVVPNTFYHNNFIDNSPEQARPLATTYWSNSGEGNYWSDYTGVDTDGDGIGETGTPHLGIDYYPLMHPIIMFGAIWKGVTYYVHAFSNSTLAAFNFSQPKKQISFNVTGPSGAFGYCHVTIPKDLLWGEYTVYLDDSQVSFNRTDSDTRAFLFFTYQPLNTQRVQIVGEYVIPEFPAAMVLPLFIIFTLVAVILKKRKEGTFKL